MRSTDVLREELDLAGGVIRRGDHPELVGAMDWLARRGEVVALLPGVVVKAALVDDVDVRIAAVRLWDPDAVITGSAAARLGFRPGLVVDEITVLTRRRLPPRPGFRFLRARVDLEDVVETSSARYTSPTFTALWLARWDAGEAVDEALRAGRTTPAGLVDRLVAMKGRVGMAARRFVVTHSREKPWSVAERRVHIALRGAAITGWSGNHPVTAGGRTWPADIVFERIRLVLEFDGFESHSNPETFHRDHEKALALMAEGWVVVRFSWPQLLDLDGLIGYVRAAIVMAERLNT